MTENVKSIENKELIEKYEICGIELNKLFMELISRYQNEELTKLEWDHVTDLSAKRGSELVDYINVDKKDLKEGFMKVADIIADENR